MTPAQDNINVGRMLLDKTYEGELSGKSNGQMLSHRSQIESSAAYVALEHFEGTLDGLSGSFSMIHTGLMQNGENSLEVGIVPDSGQGELEGITGKMDIKIEDGKHSYVLEYQFDQRL